MILRREKAKHKLWVIGGHIFHSFPLVSWHISPLDLPKSKREWKAILEGGKGRMKRKLEGKKWQCYCFPLIITLTVLSHPFHFINFPTTPFWIIKISNEKAATLRLKFVVWFPSHIYRSLSPHFCGTIGNKLPSLPIAAAIDTFSHSTILIRHQQNRIDYRRVKASKQAGRQASEWHIRQISMNETFDIYDNILFFTLLFFVVAIKLIVSDIQPS